MKAVRSVGFILLLLVVAYLVWVHSANPTFITLPGFLSLPVAPVLGTAILLGWLAGWLPSRLSSWRKDREIRQLSKRLAELDPSGAYAPQDIGGEPIIPDRPYDTLSDPS